MSVHELLHITLITGHIFYITFLKICLVCKVFFAPKGLSLPEAV